MKTKDFINRFNEVEVTQRMISVKSPEEDYAVAQEYGVTDSMEEFVEEMTKFKAAIDELTEEDLEAVAGGLSPEVIITTATAASASAVVASAASVVGSVVGATLGVSAGTTAAAL